MEQQPPRVASLEYAASVGADVPWALAVKGLAWAAILLGIVQGVRGGASACGVMAANPRWTWDALAETGFGAVGGLCGLGVTMAGAGYLCRKPWGRRLLIVGLGALLILTAVHGAFYQLYAVVSFNGLRSQWGLLGAAAWLMAGVFRVLQELLLPGLLLVVARRQELRHMVVPPVAKEGRGGGSSLHNSSGG